MNVPTRLASLISTALLVGACSASGTASSGSTAQAPAPSGSGASARVATAPVAPARPAAVTAANIALGDSLFNVGACQRCHGKGGVGAANAPALDGKKWMQLQTGSYDEIVKVITEGVAAPAIKDPTHKFAMRARGGPMNLTDDQVKAVAAYVYTLSHK